MVIEGYTSFDIQGVNLRETIESLIKKPGSKFSDIVGYVHNLKDGKVEVICRGQNVELLYHQLLLSKVDEQSKQTEERLEEYKFKNVDISDYYVTESFTDFTVKRDDDLSEMVLALRGAGYRFKKSTETLQRIHESLLKRDKDMIRGRLLMLYHELTNIIVELNQPKKDKIHLDAIRSNFDSLVIPEPGFADQLMQVYIELQEFIKTDNFRDMIDHLKENLESLKAMVGNELNTKYGINLSG